MTETEQRRRSFSLAVGLAWRLDQILKQKVGRPYNLALGAGLVLSIAATARTIATQLSSRANLIGLGFAVLFEATLLINQLAQLHEFRQAVRTKRAARRATRKKKIRENPAS
jgi:hypothetical protein